MFEILHVFGKSQTVARCDRFESSRDWICVNVLRHIRRVDDLRQSQQPRLFQSIFQNDGLERTSSLVVTKFHASRVEWNCVLLLRNLFDLAGGDEQELCFVVNEAGDEPWASDAIHVDVRTGDPFYDSLLLYG